MKQLPIFLYFTTLLAATTPRAYASEPTPQSSDQKKAAQKMFEAGDALYESARYADAVESFKQSNSLFNSPNSRLMLARSLRELGKSVEACAEFDATRKDAESSGGRYPETLRAAIAELEALKAQPSANCSSPALENVAPTASPTPANVAPPVQPLSPATEGPRPNNPLRIAAWISAGVGAVGVVGMSTFGYLNYKTYSKLDKDCPDGVCRSNVSSQVDNGETYQTLANVSLGIAVLGAVAATSLFIVSTPTTAEGSKFSLHLSPNTVRIDGQF